MANVKEYTQALLGLLPQGKAWQGKTLPTLLTKQTAREKAARVAAEAAEAEAARQAAQQASPSEGGGASLAQRN